MVLGRKHAGVVVLALFIVSRVEARARAAEIAALVNSKSDATWKARADWDGFAHVKPMLGATLMTPAAKRLRMRPPVNPSPASLPLRFDAREQWPQCIKMNEILDQGHCGSCWAFGSVNAMTDRNCIKNGVNLTLSHNDVLACCDSCGDGCHGGLPMAAYDYWVENGLVSNDCDPYFDTVGCKHPGCVPVYDTPTCVQQCSAADTTGELWAQAKWFAREAYAVPENQYEIMHEVMRDGPVTASFTVFIDFTTYQSGIYRHLFGESEGIHAVKILGWGSENGTDYWTVANSWRPDWGENGFFRIIRGIDDCGIESSVIAGLPASMAENRKRGGGGPGPLTNWQ